jgi:ribose 5-phosphate isomerase RpiB
VVGVEVAAQIVLTFLQAKVSDGERHVRRRAKVAEIERTGGGVGPQA